MLYLIILDLLVEHQLTLCQLLMKTVIQHNINLTPTYSTLFTELWEVASNFSNHRNQEYNKREKKVSNYTLR